MLTNLAYEIYRKKRLHSFRKYYHKIYKSFNSLPHGNLLLPLGGGSHGNLRVSEIKKLDQKVYSSNNI
jgi:hypothetical protein